jgi:hypothetical protein
MRAENTPGPYFCALEHQVLEEMGDARLARLFVGRTDLVPHHVGDDRRAPVGNDDDLKPVVEGEVLDLRRLLLGKGGRRRKRKAGSERAAQAETANQVHRQILLLSRDK